MKTLGKKTLGLLCAATSTVLFLVAFVFAAMAADYPKSERAVRPLAWMVKNHYGDRDRRPGAEHV